VELSLHDLVVGRPGFTLGPLSARFGPGVWHVTGPNGAGKTTLLRTLAGDLRPVSGSVRLDGHDVTRETAARRDVGLVTVDPELPDFLTVDEAWRMLAALRGRDGAGSAERLAALHLRPDVRLGTCSAGMRRKAEIVAALAGEPRVLLLDEPFAGLDVAASEVLRGWIDGWRTERVILLVHHGDLGLVADGVLRAGAGEAPAPVAG
jgi:ABC-2 type transport system ATP-binding protein